MKSKQKALNWLLKHQFEGAAELLATLATRRKKEDDMEEMKTEEQVKLDVKTGQQEKDS